MSFLPDTATFIQFLIATMIVAITPGPDMTLFVGRTLSEGRGAGLACMFGALTGCAIHTALVALGLSALILASPQAFWLLKLFGAGYLIWLAFVALRHGSAFQPAVAGGVAGGGRRHTLLQNWLTGIGINLLNPKVILFFMTFLPQFVSATDPHAIGKLFVLGGIFIVGSLPVNIPIILAAGQFSRLLTRSPGIMRAIDYLFAGVFSAFAIRILMAQAR
jgi:threonine/homoserine/homoserine lactone efflux protein